MNENPIREKLEKYRIRLDEQEYRDGQGPKTPWIVSEAFQLGPSVVDELNIIGEEAMAFLYKCSKLIGNEHTRNELTSSLPEENRKGLERLEKLAKTGMPILVRPDLIVDQSGKLWVTEIDLNPAGPGILQKMQEIYQPHLPTIAQIWAEMVDQPIVLSIPEYKLHHPEHNYFAERVNQFAEKEMIRSVPIEKWNQLENYEGIIFKSCCTMSLMTMDYPPFIPNKAVIAPMDILDWKGWLALASKEDALQKQRLSKRVPETYLLPLKPGNKTYETCKRKELLDISSKERGKWVIKPVHSWGAKGFKTGNELNLDEWNGQILGLQNKDASQGMLLQKKVDSARYKVDGLTPEGEIVSLDGLRIRLSPFYIMWKGQIKLAGSLITLRKSNKVHGASDAVITLLSN